MKIKRKNYDVCKVFIMPEIMHGEASEVFLPPLAGKLLFDLNSVGATQKLN